MQGDRGTCQGANIKFWNDSNYEASSSMPGKIKVDSAEFSGAISSRVSRYGKWRFYAVRRGRSVGIFRTWPKCERQVKYYSGAIFKGFNTEEEANLFLRRYDLSLYRKDM